MTKRLRNPFKNSKLKAILFFLLLATFFWILTKFSREYTATTKASLNYRNIPETTLLTDDNPKSIEFDLTATGFEFLVYKLKNPSIDIDTRRYYTNGEKLVTIPKNELIKLISSDLKANLAVRNLSIEELQVTLDELVSKKVIVVAKTDFSYKDGFKPLDSVTIVPDSIVVTGPSKYLDSIGFVETIQLKADNLDESVSMSAGLEKYKSKKVSFTPKDVMVSVEVAEFSQKEMILPIEIINLPKDITIKLIPDIVTVIFDVSMEDFKEIAENDFRVICDYNERNSDENFMIPRLVESPEGIRHIEFGSKKIDYLIFK